MKMPIASAHVSKQINNLKMITLIIDQQAINDVTQALALLGTDNPRTLGPELSKALDHLVALKTIAGEIE